MWEKYWGPEKREGINGDLAKRGTEFIRDAQQTQEVLSVHLRLVPTNLK